MLEVISENDRYTIIPDCRIDICSIVNNKSTYKLLMESLSGYESSRFINMRYIDNTEAVVVNAVDAINWFIASSQSRYVMVCHQDVIFSVSDVLSLLGKLKELDELDRNWAVCGNAGRNNGLQIRCHISDPYGANQFSGPLPCKCIGLDENVLIYNRKNPILLSKLVSGFHNYGIESCYVAHRLGYSSYVVDFHVLHSSAGTFDSHYHNLSSDWHTLRTQASSQVIYCSTYFKPLVLGVSKVINKWIWKPIRIIRTIFGIR